MLLQAKRYPIAGINMLVMPVAFTFVATVLAPFFAADPPTEIDMMIPTAVTDNPKFVADGIRGCDSYGWAGNMSFEFHREDGEHSPLTTCIRKCCCSPPLRHPPRLTKCPAAAAAIDFRSCSDLTESLVNDDVSGTAMSAYNFCVNHFRTLSDCIVTDGSGPNDGPCTCPGGAVNPEFSVYIGAGTQGADHDTLAHCLPGQLCTEDVGCR